MNILENPATHTLQHPHCNVHTAAQRELDSLYYIMEQT